MSGTVLIVEDEPLIAMGIADIVEDRGLDVIMVSDRQDAERHLQDSGLVGAIVDWRLKGELGDAVVDRLVALDVPVIICSGSDQKDVPERFRRLPFVGKPFQEDDLRNTLMSVFALKPESKEPPLR